MTREEMKEFNRKFDNETLIKLSNECFNLACKGIDKERNLLVCETIHEVMNERK